MKSFKNFIINLSCFLILGITIFVLYNYKFSIVISGSMEPTIMTGDMIIEKKNHNDSYEIGDIISFNVGEQYPICHRIIKYNQSGNYFTTKGDNNNISDNYRVNNSNILGKVVYNSSFLGKLYTEYRIPIIIAILSLISITLYHLIHKYFNKKGEK